MQPKAYLTLVLLSLAGYGLTQSMTVPAPGNRGDVVSLPPMQGVGAANAPTTASAPATLASTVTIPRDPLELLGSTSVVENGKTTHLVAVRTVGGSVVRIYNTAGKLQRQVSLPPEVMLKVKPALSPDGKWLAVALQNDPVTGEGRVGLLSTNTQGVYQKFIRAAGIRDMTTFGFNPAGTRLIVGNLNSYVQVWDITTSKRLSTVMGRGAVQSLNFAPDGRSFIPYFAQGKESVLISSETGEKVGLIPGAFPGTARPLVGGMVFISPGKVKSIAAGNINMPLPAFLIGGASPVAFDRTGETVLVQLPRSLKFQRRSVMTGDILSQLTLPSMGPAPRLTSDGRQAIFVDDKGDLQITR